VIKMVDVNVIEGYFFVTVKTFIRPKTIVREEDVAILSS